MIRQKANLQSGNNCKIFDFIEFRRNKPFFLKPIKITVGNPINTSYSMVKNLVYKGKQILALKQEQQPDKIFLVEAKIENGQLIHISMVPDHIIGDISRMFRETV